MAWLVVALVEAQKSEVVHVECEFYTCLLEDHQTQRKSQNQRKSHY